MRTRALTKEGTVPVIPLPDDPDLAQLRRRARELQRAVRAGDADAIAAAVELHPRPPAPFTLSAAQLVVARTYGFASWARLKQHVELVNSLTRRPDAVGEQADPADEVLRLACLTYQADDPVRRQRAAALLRPELVQSSVHLAAACADVAAVDRLLGERPASAGDEGGPFRWPPSMYLAYARHDPDVSQTDTLATARLLLRAGADPNAGYLWHGLPSAFTVLTGVLGEGELGPVTQPRHPHWQALARLLLEAGADANDSQGVYNRMFEPGVEHLEVLCEFGFGRGDGGPWRRRLGDAALSPAQLVDQQLHWAVTHDMADRVALLAANGADLTRPLRGGRTAVELAALAGHDEMVAALRAAGAPHAPLDDVDRLISRLAAGDRSAAEAMATTTLIDAAKRRRPSLLVDAVAANRRAAVELLLDLGFDPNAFGRGDVPENGQRETALHVAAGEGFVELAELLLARGADPAIRDQWWSSTPLGWAQQMNQPATIALLEPLTPD